MPNALELPGMLSAVIPLMCARYTVVNEFVALAFLHAIGTFQFLRAAPGRVPLLSAVIGTLDDLAEPSTGLRCINPVRIDRRTFYVINFPARKMRAADFPSFARAIRCQDERTFSCTNQYSYFAHSFFLTTCLIMSSCAKRRISGFLWSNSRKATIRDVSLRST